jgi:hypothetical protein
MEPKLTPVNARSLTRLVSTCVFAVAAVVATATPAYAVAANGTYSNWYWPGPGTGYYNYDELVTIIGHSPGTHYFWAHQIGYVNGDGGYLGLQVGSYPNNTKIALFSLWGANGARGANCGTFNEGGAGYTCRLDPYNWVTGRAYRLRIWAVGQDGKGEWWGAWVQDTVTGVDSYVGKIRVPTSWGWLRGDWSVSWTEYFGTPASTCDTLPWAKAEFRYPTANDGSVQIASHTPSIASGGDCPGYSQIYQIPGADVQEMGRQPVN